MNRFYLKIYALSIIFIFNFVIFSADSTFAQDLPLLSDNYSVQFIYPKPQYPSYGSILQTSKLKTTVKGQGLIGSPFYDPYTGERIEGFQFPVNRGANYMQFSGLWVGGIVDNDTLVSTSICKEFVPYYNRFYSLQYINDFHPDYINDDTATTIRYETENGEIFHSTFTDTLIPVYQPWSIFLEKHRPMGLHVTLKTYTEDITPFKNIVLLDFIITNKGGKKINSAYVGMYVNTLVTGGCTSTQIYLDDLVGSFQDDGTVYVMDNDGDLNIANCQNGQATGSMALKTMITYPPPTDTNFNWWTNWNLDYGPQKFDFTNNTLRNLGNDVYGTPTGDSNRYYVMSHPEWDYDQCFTKTTTKSDSSWAPVHDTILSAISKGNTPNFLLSLGPFDIPPDSSVRTIFALIGTDLIHLYSNNYANLITENFLKYYDNLFFDIFFDNLRFATLLTEKYTNPLAKPLGLRINYLSKNSINLNWDNFVFPEVIGYKVYLKEIPENYLLSSNIVRPNIVFDSLPTEITQYSTNSNELLFENLDPSKKYLAVVSHMTTTNEGKNSDPIVLGIDNPFIVLPEVIPFQKFVSIHPEDQNIKLLWNIQDSNEIAYYKIYKAQDSARAFTRHASFLYPYPNELPIQSTLCFENDNSTICYYEWLAYDSVESYSQEYIDNLAENDSYYWVTAVNNYGIESELSQNIKSVRPPEITKDIVAIIGTYDATQEFTYDDSIVDYYNELLAGYDYDIYKWTDSNLINVNCSSKLCTNWEDLAKYKLVIVNEYSSPKILTEKTESTTKLFTILSDLGHNIVYFGIPSGNQPIDISKGIDSVHYDNLSFEHNYMGLYNMGLKSWSLNYKTFDTIDSLSGFNAAIPTETLLPELRIKQEPTFFTPFIRQLYSFDNFIPYVPAFTPTESTQVLYTYASAFPETSLLHGKPVGIVKENRNNKFYTFGFHLWSMELHSAKKLVQYLYSKLPQPFPPPTLPSQVTLNQNYPNPFNAGTTFSFSLPKQQIVTAEIFNILGQKIKTLLQSKEMPAGSHWLNWDATNDQNNSVATGIYLYRIKTYNNNITKKMVLLK